MGPADSQLAPPLDPALYSGHSLERCVGTIARRQSSETCAFAAMTNVSKTPSIKKKRISKHVLKSRQSQKVEAGNASNGPRDVGNGNVDGTSLQPTADSQSGPLRNSDLSSSADPSKRKRKKKRNSHVKDPEEATTYLSNWKASKASDDSGRSPVDAPSVWKFNKNTQSWLIRHMYECDKVAKGTFTLLQEYLKGLEGTITKDRIRTEATRRVLRYKEHCHALTPLNAGTKGASVEGRHPSGSGELEDVDVAIAKTSVQDPSFATQEEMEEEETRWKSLDEHNKKKEYKRARKILDLFSRKSPNPP